MSPRLLNKVTIITGGTSGIGTVAVERFIEEGAKVIIAARNEERGQAIVDRLGSNAYFHKTDISKESSIKALIDMTMSTHGRIDCLFNNAGAGSPDGAISTLPLDGFNDTVNLMLTGVMLGMKYVAPIMIEQQSGSIINTASVAGSRVGFGSHSYNAVKAAVIHASRSVASELGEHGIRVNALSPGGVVTEIFAREMGVPDHQIAQAETVTRRMLSQMAPIARAGESKDIADAAVYLASDESSYVNGHDFVVDGGLIGGRKWTESNTWFSNEWAKAFDDAGIEHKING